MAKEMVEAADRTFVRLAEKRVRKALNDLRLIENLGRYPHDHKQTGKIMEYLRTAVEQVEYALGGEKGKQAQGFSLEEE